MSKERIVRLLKQELALHSDKLPDGSYSVIDYYDPKYHTVRVVVSILTDIIKMVEREVK